MILTTAPEMVAAILEPQVAHRCTALGHGDIGKQISKMFWMIKAK